MNKEEIEEYKETLYDLISDEDVYNSIKIAVKGIFSYIDQLEQENKKLSKMIDEMASYISDFDVDEDICKKVKISPCTDETSVPVSYCIECIKQYFEKKVEEENQQLKQKILGILKGEN